MDLRLLTGSGEKLPSDKVTQLASQLTLDEYSWYALLVTEFIERLIKNGNFKMCRSIGDCLSVEHLYLMAAYHQENKLNGPSDINLSYPISYVNPQEKQRN